MRNSNNDCEKAVAWCLTENNDIITTKNIEFGERNNACGKDNAVFCKYNL